MAETFAGQNSYHCIADIFNLWFSGINFCSCSKEPHRLYIANWDKIFIVAKKAKISPGKISGSTILQLLWSSFPVSLFPATTHSSHHSLMEHADQIFEYSWVYVQSDIKHFNLGYNLKPLCESVTPLFNIHLIYIHVN